MSKQTENNTITFFIDKELIKIKFNSKYITKNIKLNYIVFLSVIYNFKLYPKVWRYM